MGHVLSFRIRVTTLTIKLGTPINIESNAFEAKTSLTSIIQNSGYAGLRELSQNTNPINNEKLVREDDRRTRRSQENMENVKKKKIEKLKSQKQFSSKGANLGLYKGPKGKHDESDENIAPSNSYLCSQPSNMSANK